MKKLFSRFEEKLIVKFNLIDRETEPNRVESFTKLHESQPCCY